MISFFALFNTENAKRAAMRGSGCHHKQRVNVLTMPARTSAPDLAHSSDEVVAALKGCRSTFGGIAVFSACISVLSLTGALYMLQISDRVLASRSISTLVFLSLLALGAYLLLGMLDALRCRMLARVGAKFSAAADGPRLHSGNDTRAQRHASRRRHPGHSRSRSGSEIPVRLRTDRVLRHAVHADLLHRRISDASGLRRPDRRRRRGDRHLLGAHRNAHARADDGGHGQRRGPPRHRRIQLPKRRSPQGDGHDEQSSRRLSSRPTRAMLRTLSTAAMRPAASARWPRSSAACCSPPCSAWAPGSRSPARSRRAR